MLTFILLPPTTTLARLWEEEGMEGRLDGGRRAAHQIPFPQNQLLAGSGPEVNELSTVDQVWNFDWTY